jgi:hypothetical protein
MIRVGLKWLWIMILIASNPFNLSAQRIANRIECFVPRHNDDL